MPLLASRAAQVADAAGVHGVEFEQADLLACELSTSKIVLLASQCWDGLLIEKLRGKLLAELEDGALVLDYTPALGELRTSDIHSSPGAAAAPSNDPCRRFALQCTVDAPVSWDGAHRFWVWSVETCM